jgi:hypothetical protein
MYMGRQPGTLAQIPLNAESPLTAWENATFVEET